MLIELKAEQIPVTAPLVLTRVAEARILEDFDIDYALSQAAHTVTTGVGAVFVDNDIEPKRVLWVVAAPHNFFKRKTCFVMLIMADEDARNIRDGLELLRTAQKWAERRECKELSLSAWLTAGPDIGPLLEAFGASLQERVYSKKLT